MKNKRFLLLSYCTVVLLFLYAVFCSNRVVTTMIENAPILRKYTLVIDAGHGGVDGGATSCSGKLESAFNLEISLRLKDLFHLLGYETKMIRSSDQSIYTKGDTIAQKKISDLKERVNIVNNTENGVLLSIHQNIFSDSRYSGAQVFYGKEKGSEPLAKALQSAFATTLNPGSHRQAKRSEGIYLMDHIERPGVLIECGFLSNPEEESKLRSASYQKKLVCVIASQVSSFLSNT